MNKLFRTIFIIIIFTFFNLLSLSKDLKISQKIKFKSYTVEDGLSNNVIYSIAQDHRGLMWFGTDNKLNMFDGYRFKYFEHNLNNPDSLSTNSASNIYLDRDGYLWIGTWGGGLEKHDYENKKFIHYKNDPEDDSTLSDNRVQSLYNDTKGNLWIGTYRGGLNKLNLKSGVITRYQNDSNNPDSISNDRVWSITEEDSGNILIGTSNGLNYYDVDSEKFQTFYPNENDPKAISATQIRTLHKGAKNRVWVGTNRGLNLFNNKTKSFKQYFPDNYNEDDDNFVVNSILEEENEILWIGTTEGLYKFDIKTEKFISFYFPGSSDFSNINYADIRSIYKDKTGLIWLGTRGGGINTFNPNLTFSYLGDFGTGSNTKTIIEDSDGKLWISKNNKLLSYDIKNNKTTEYPHKFISTSYLDSNKNLWLGNEKGTLFKYNKQKDIFDSYQVSNSQNITSNRILTIKEYKDNTLWIGTYGNGALKFDVKSKTVIKHLENSGKKENRLSGNEVYAVHHDTSDNLWFGTNNGLNLYDDKLNKIYPFSKGYVYSIHEDKNQNLWFGSRRGLYNLILAPTEDPETMARYLILYNTKNGLPSDLVFGILEDDQNNLWLSTEFGLSKFNRKKLSFRNYHAKDGLQGNKFNVNSFYKGNNGKMYFGGIKGVSIFHPSEIKENINIPNIIITNFKKFEKNIEFDKAITEMDLIELTHKDVFFSFEFAALDYHEPSKNQFHYKLIGFDQEWISNTNRNYVRYTNIPPGKYTFLIKGSNSDGYENIIGDKMDIIITPPWWDKLSFKISAFLIISGMIFSLYLYRINILKNYSKKLEALVQERTEQLKISNQELARLVRIDSLTQIPNRRYFDETLSQEWLRMKRDQKYLSLIFIDIDYFKKYNDFYGHQAGDQCLIDFAQMLSKVPKRPADLVCRYGGEEFCIILPDTESKNAKYIAELIRKELRKLEIYHNKSEISEYVTCSMGISSTIPDNNTASDELIETADLALYQAKTDGRDRVVLGTMKSDN